MKLWEVKYKGGFAPKIVEAATFLEAVAKASESSSEIISVSYLCY
jgi:hypothetical protein